MISPDEIRYDIIRPALYAIEYWSQAAENLLLGTAAVESNMGRFKYQLNGGPALGIFQIEPATHEDVCLNFLKFRPELAKKVVSKIPSVTDISQRPDNKMLLNDKYSATIARIIYLRAPEKLPAANDIEGLARYWKNYYNTVKGKGRAEDFLQRYSQLMLV